MRSRSQCAGVVVSSRAAVLSSLCLAPSLAAVADGAGQQLRYEERTRAMTSQAIEFAINGSQDTIHDTVELWKQCDRGGVHTFGIPDSAIRSTELYSSTTLCAVNTSKVRIMPCVTNPLTRHPSVTACGIATLDALAPGRAALGIATGDSSIWGVGMKPARVEQLREYIVAVKGLLEGREVTYQGKTFRQHWERWRPSRHVPVYVACSGPKILKMAAQVADGVIVTMGFSDEDVAYVRGVIAEGCAEVGRDPRELDIWWNAYVVFAPSIEEAKNKSLGWSMSWLAMTTMEGKRIPEEYREKLERLTQDKHDINAVYANPDRHAVLVERSRELGIHDWLLSRSPQIFGRPEDIAKRMRELAAKGMPHWMFYITGTKEARTTLVEKLTQGVIPRLR